MKSQLFCKNTLNPYLVLVLTQPLPMNTADRRIHQGRNIKRFREMLGIKQEVLAYQLGDEWSQKKISLLEQKEEVEAGLLSQIAEVLNLPVEAFQNFDEEQAVNIISNTFNHGSVGYQKNENCTIHPVDKILQLHDEKIALYERMLKEKDDMMERLERLIGKK